MRLWRSKNPSSSRRVATVERVRTNHIIRGGEVYVDGDLTINHSTVTDNHAPIRQGPFSVDSHRLSLVDSVLEAICLSPIRSELDSFGTDQLGGDDPEIEREGQVYLPRDAALSR
jgi:hypothetical protein